MNRRVLFMLACAAVVPFMAVPGGAGIPFVLGAVAVIAVVYDSLIGGRR